MSILKLWFSSGPAPELLKTYFEHPLLAAPRSCVRGRSAGALVGAGTFQWRPAVQALVLLVLRTRLNINDELGHPTLLGAAGSPASSLEYMLRKRPDWLTEMFGTSPKGEPIVERLIIRHNSANRRPGGMALCFAPSVRQSMKIEIYLDGILASDEAQIEDLRHKIETAWKPHSTPTVLEGRSESSANYDQKFVEPKLLSGEVRQRLASIIREEIICILRMTDIFSSQSYAKVVRRMLTHPLFVKLAGRKTELFEDSEAALLASGKLGFEADDLELSRVLTAGVSIRVHMAAIPSSASAMFMYLRDVKKYNIEICFDHDHAGDLVNVIQHETYDNAPDLFVFGLPSAARVIQHAPHSGYKAYMPLPRHSVRIVSAKKRREDLGSSLSKGVLYCGCDQPTSALFALHALEEAGVASATSIKCEHSNPNEIFARMRAGDEDAKAMVFFPHHQFNRIFNKCSYLDSAHIDLTLVDSMLMAHDSFLSDRYRALCLDKAIRNAWLELSDGGAILDSLIDAMLNDPRYVRRMAHSAGLELQALSEVRFDEVA